MWLLGFTGTSKAMKTEVFSVDDDDDGNYYLLHASSVAGRLSVDFLF